jgi:DNA invertase Pin-like site-specific DNA recombinase
MAFVGYARVSTLEQETRLQLDALYAFGVSRVYQEKVSSVSSRPQLQRALLELLPGDTLVVWKLDRLARSLLDLLGILESLARVGCSFRSLTEPVDTSTPMGVFVLQILGAVAQLERAMIIQRTTAGIRAARARGIPWGRPSVLSSSDRFEVASLSVSGLPVSDIALAYGVSRALVYKISDAYRQQKPDV